MHRKLVRRTAQFLIIVGLIGSAIWALAPEHWLTSPPDEAIEGDFSRLPEDQVFFVSAGRRWEANALLFFSPWHQVSLAQFRRLCPNSITPRHIGLRPYLVRCVSTGEPAPECEVSLNPQLRYVSASCSVLTHSDTVTWERTPAVVFLDQAPLREFVGAGTAE